MRDLLVIVPSRGRPASIERLWDAMAVTCRGDTTLLLGLDDDDPALTAYPPGPQRECRGGLRQVVAWINELAVPRTQDYRFIGTIGDDNLPSTPGWDTAIMEALETAPFAFGNDLYPTRPPGSLCCHVFCQSRVIEQLGYFGPPEIRHMYVDPVWYAWGQATSITFLPEVIIEHLHYTTGKSPADESYAASLAMTGRDLTAYHSYTRSRMNDDIRKLGGRPFTEESLAAFNRDLNIPHTWPGGPGSPPWAP